MNRPLPHGHWLERVLGYESLPEAARLETDAHLLGCAECRALRERLLAGERLAFATESVPDPLSEVALAGEALEAERSSRAALLRRIPLALPTPARAARPRRGWWVWAATSVAAAAAILIWAWPRGEHTIDTPGALSGTIEHAAEMRGAPTNGWRTGDAFQLRLTLPHAGYVVVFVVDERGELTRLFPSDSASASRRFAAGELVLPAPGSAERWSFTGTAGRETFLATLTPAGVPEPDAIEHAARQAAAGGASRDTRIAAIAAALEAASVQVLRLDTAHDGRAEQSETSR